MNRRSLLIGFLLIQFVLQATGQTANQYNEYVKKAELYLESKEYLKAAKAYSKAFSSNRGFGRIDHRYEAARCWARAGEVDSAFYNLDRIAKSGGFTKYYIVTNDSSFHRLHRDNRWLDILFTVKRNKDKLEPNLNERLAAILDTIYYDDQHYRKKLGEIESRFGRVSYKVDSIWQLIHKKDSINLIKVKNILNQHGWLGADKVGRIGNDALFLVIQHSNPETWVKYLPTMRKAVKDGNATASDLALLEDRTALAQGKKQIYGSQILINPNTGNYYVRPLKKPKTVDKRRKRVGLPLMADYVKQFGINWSVEQYKRDLKKAKGQVFEYKINGS